MRIWDVSDRIRQRNFKRSDICIAINRERNFLVHEYVDVDDEAIFKTIREDLPALKSASKDILSDLNEGKLDKFFKN